MSKKMLSAFWGCGDSQIIDFAIERARLNKKEREAVRLVLDDCCSQDEAAERMSVSTRLFQEYWRTASRKLMSIPWVIAYAKDILNKEQI